MDPLAADLRRYLQEERESVLASFEQLPLDAPASVSWWPEERRATTFGSLLVRVVAETAHHAGHADIVRELIDGRSGADHEEIGDTEW